MTKSIYRYEVPVDDKPHTLELSGEIVHVATRDSASVEVWAWHTGGHTIERAFQVVGTGQPLPEGWTRHVGTAIAPGGRLVWHLLEGAW
jgi:hypothetical protein